MPITRRELLAARRGLPLAAHQAQNTEAFARLRGARKQGAQTWFSQAGLGLFLSLGHLYHPRGRTRWGFYGDVGGKKGAWPVGLHRPGQGVQTRNPTTRTCGWKPRPRPASATLP